MSLEGRRLEGFSWQPVVSDESQAWSAYWMKLDAGAQSPIHVHPATELVLIHTGALHDDNGRVYGPGDLVVYAAGSSHTTVSLGGCCALVVTSAPAHVLEG